MKVKLPILITFVFILTAPITESHLLWASYNQCVATLGEPECVSSNDRGIIPPATELCLWRKGAWGIMIHFWDRRAHWISSEKLDHTAVSATELQAILDAFADGNSWVEIADEHKLYRRSDHKVSVLVVKEYSIEVFTEEMEKAIELRP